MTYSLHSHATAYTHCSMQMWETVLFFFFASQKNLSKTENNTVRMYPNKLIVTKYIYYDFDQLECECAHFKLESNLTILIYFRWRNFLVQSQSILHIWSQWFKLIWIFLSFLLRRLALKCKPNEWNMLADQWRFIVRRFNALQCCNVRTTHDAMICEQWTFLQFERSNTTDRHRSSAVYWRPLCA